MMAVKKRHTRKVLKKDIFDELVKPDAKKEFNEDDLSEVLKIDEEETYDLNAIAEFYHKKLFENEEALEYLKSKGIVNAEIYSRFKIGFADGSLLNILSKKQSGLVKESGLIMENGQETFLSCLIFHVFDENDRLSCMYGINIENDQPAKPVYFTDIIPIFNHKAVKVYDEVILTSSIMDALSLIELGIENVIALNDESDFTESHIKLLKDNRVKTVILAFDNDIKNMTAADSLKDILLREDFRIKVISPPQTAKEWNDALLSGLEAQFIKNLIENTELFKPEEVESDRFSVKKDGVRYIFRIGGLTYEVTGVKEVFVSNLRVNVRLKYEDENFPDNLDLYSARSRSLYSQNIAKIFDIEPKRIEKDLIKILDYFEYERDRALRADDQTKEMELTEEEREIGLSFLKSKDMFTQIVDDMTTLGYVGEDLNKQLLYLCASSRKLDDPISVLIVSQSASGKSMLVDTVRKLLPDEEVIFITSLSDQALNYMPDGGLIHKFLILGEAVHSEVIEHQLREMLSAHELTRLVTVKDDKTGQMVSRQVKRKTVVSSVMSTTSHRINPENASRCFLINSDESKEQTKKIHASQKDKYSLKRYLEKRDVIPDIITKHKSAQRMLKKVIIVNPFASLIDFPVSLMRLRRDHDRFIDLIAVACFVRQYQKELKTDGKFEYIECDLTDYEIARDIMVLGGALSSSLADLPTTMVRFYEELRELAGEKAKKNGLKILDSGFDQREIRKKIKWIGSETIKKYLRILVSYEYLRLRNGGNRGQRNIYTLVANESIEKIDLTMIPTVDEIKEKIKKKRTNKI